MNQFQVLWQSIEPYLYFILILFGICCLFMVYKLIKSMVAKKREAIIAQIQEQRRLEEIRQREEEERIEREKLEEQRKRLEEEKRREEAERKLQEEKDAIVNEFQNEGLAVSFTDNNEHVVVMNSDFKYKIRFDFKKEPGFSYEAISSAGNISFLEICSGPAKGAVSLLVGYGKYFEAYRIIVNWIKANKRG